MNPTSILSPKFKKLLLAPCCALPVAPSPVIGKNSRSTGRHAIALGFTWLWLLQWRALRPLTHRELEHLSDPSAISSRRLGVHTGFGARAPIAPLSHLAVLREEAGLDGQRQVPRYAQAGKRERGWAQNAVKVWLWCGSTLNQRGFFCVEPKRDQWRKHPNEKSPAHNPE